MPVRAPVQVEANTKQLVIKARQWERIPAPTKEKVVATRALLQLEKFSKKLPDALLREMDDAMSQLPTLGGTGIVRRPTPMHSTTRSPGRVESRPTPYESETRETQRMGRTGLTGTVAATAFQPRYGDGGSTGLTVGGRGTLRSSGTLGGMPETEFSHERCQPRPLRSSGLSTRPPLRVAYLEPTASVGLVSPVRATKFTAW